MSAVPTNFAAQAERCQRCRRALAEWEEPRPVLVVAAVDEHGLDCWALQQWCIGCTLRLSGELRRQYAFDSRVRRARPAPRPFTPLDAVYLNQRIRPLAEIMSGRKLNA